MHQPWFFVLSHDHRSNFPVIYSLRNHLRRGSLGGALFCDRRFGRVFVYHNGAESYYGVRGFRGLLRI